MQSRSRTITLKEKRFWLRHHEKTQRSTRCSDYTPQGYIDEYLNVAGIAGNWKCRGFGSNGTGFYGLVGLTPETASVCRTDAIRHYLPLDQADTSPNQPPALGQSIASDLLSGQTISKRSTRRRPERLRKFSGGWGNFSRTIPTGAPCVRPLQDAIGFEGAKVMATSAADAPLTVSTDGTAGPYVLVTSEQLGPVAEALRRGGPVPS